MKVRDLNTNTELDPDWSCHQVTAINTEAGQNTALDAGSASTRPVTFHLGPLLPSMYAGLTVDFFFGSSTLGTPAVTHVLDADAGTVTLSVPQSNTFVSVWIHAIERDIPSLSIFEVREYYLPISTASSSIEGFAIFKDSRTLAERMTLGGGQPDPTKAVIISAAGDCRGRAVSGAQFELIDVETNLPVPTGTAPDVAHSSYYQFAIPSTTCIFTSNEQQEATWMMVNAPVNVTSGTKTHSYRLRLKGRMRATDAAPVTIAEREVELFADTVSLIRLAP
jgi:hypothetical protein